MQKKIAQRSSRLNSFRRSHFAPAFFLLSRERRDALKIVYAVFRLLDDAVDDGVEDPRPLLSAWKRAVESGDAEAVRSFGYVDLAAAYLDVAQRYGIPAFPMTDFIDKGLLVDVEHPRFETPMDTERYCYAVAGTVGIACLPIFGVPWTEGKDFAIRLGIAVQWINLIRDVGVDAAMGRLYLPLDHLEQFGYTEADIFGLKNKPNLAPLLQHEADVARAHYRRAMELLPPQWNRELLPARLMGKLYLALLEKLENRNFPVYDGSLRLGAWEKIVTTWRVLREKK